MTESPPLCSLLVVLDLFGELIWKGAVALACAPPPGLLATGNE